ncbi:MAG TPA: metalloregulator ArsR/SmtB family transcription factor [Candidatus Acidoferrales bacterium]|nr:metalloregulator ArsR/SmtB family transcription factor [Candidatus Acidoferrales bacterium]
MRAAGSVENTLAKQLEALADPTRRHILGLLKRKGSCSCAEVNPADPGLCVCDLESALSLRQPTISHHIQVLREVGLISTRKIGRWLYCRRNEEALDKLTAWLKKL